MHGRTDEERLRVGKRRRSVRQRDLNRLSVRTLQEKGLDTHFAVRIVESERPNGVDFGSVRVS